MTIKKTAPRPGTGAKRPSLKSGRRSLPQNKMDDVAAELKQLREENALLKANLGLALFGKAEIDKQALLSEFGKPPSILDLIEELKCDGD